MGGGHIMSQWRVLAATPCRLHPVPDLDDAKVIVSSKFDLYVIHAKQIGG